MARYYGIVRSDEYLEHYGIKGMKWGVRKLANDVQKAIKNKDKKKVKDLHEKAKIKLASLQGKANLVVQRQNRRENAKLAGAGAGIAASGVAAGMANKYSKIHTGDEWYAAGLGIPIPMKVSKLANAGVALGGAMGIGSGIAAAKNHYRLGQKGHAKAIQNVNDYQEGMHEAFKGTEFEKRKRKPYNDTYELYDYAKIKNGSPTKIASIQGSHLTRNYKGKDKNDFINTFENNSSHVVIRSPKNNNTRDAYDGYETNYQNYTGRQPKKKKK